MARLIFAIKIWRWLEKGEPILYYGTSDLPVFCVRFMKGGVHYCSRCAIEDLNFPCKLTFCGENRDQQCLVNLFLKLIWPV